MEKGFKCCALLLCPWMWKDLVESWFCHGRIWGLLSINKREWMDAKFGDQKYHPLFTCLNSDVVFSPCCPVLFFLHYSERNEFSGCRSGGSAQQSHQLLLETHPSVRILVFFSAPLVGRLETSSWIYLHTSVLPSSDNIWQCGILGWISFPSNWIPKKLENSYICFVFQEFLVPPPPPFFLIGKCNKILA